MYISLQDLGIFLVFSIVAAASIFLIITLIKFNKMLNEVNNRIVKNDEKIQKTIDNFAATSENINVITTSLKKNKHIFDETIPASISNIHSISETLKNTTEKVDKSLDVVNLNLMETASAVKENTQDIITYIRVIGEAVRVLVQLVFKK
ncbi:hypothetical protein [Desulfitibacter alkalitolerans]|uniref:hypothetical protein n=1 Tax=Desulfitibacter alkalitolerans TaxID=264641 RepID=UPI0004842FB8|nr:hypothetical protein [Desulfitibacter alkalitolerans]